MTDFALPGSIEPAAKRPNLDKGFNPLTLILFSGILAAGMLFVAYSLYVDVAATDVKVTTYLPFILLFVALLIALGFEFVNGFHDTANAVATVIYTHSLPAEAAVVWSGFFNFLGVAFSSGAVAFGIISLLPVELILQVGKRAASLPPPPKATRRGDRPCRCRNVGSGSRICWGWVRNLRRRDPQIRCDDAVRATSGAQRRSKLRADLTQRAGDQNASHVARRMNTEHTAD
jgi:hypothetical protein